MGFILTILFIIAQIVLVFMGAISVTMAFLIIIAWFGAMILDRLMVFMRARTKIIFILIPVVILGFTGILPADAAWVFGVLITLNCIFNRGFPTIPPEYFEDITVEQILKDKGISDPTFDIPLDSAKTSKNEALEDTDAHQELEDTNK